MIFSCDSRDFELACDQVFFCGFVSYGCDVAVVFLSFSVVSFEFVGIFLGIFVYFLVLNAERFCGVLHDFFLWFCVCLELEINVMVSPN